MGEEFELFVRWDVEAVGFHNVCLVCGSGLLDKIFAGVQLKNRRLPSSVLLGDYTKFSL